MRSSPRPTSSARTGRSSARTARSLADLVAAGLLQPGRQPELAPVAARYAIAITPAVADLIDPGNPDDPMARQFIPDRRELETTNDERADPIGDAVHEVVPGVIHRYPDRVLLKLVHACPVYCRFCFRREMVGPGGAALNGEGFEAALSYIAAHPEIWEVVITGGDPFILSARRIGEITRRLGAIAHLKVIRWHSRVPVVDPDRITPAFAKALRIKGKATYVAIHANHPREFSKSATVAIDRLADAGLVLISQSVLLRGVNADVETLTELMRAFTAHRIKPYYLHHPDLAPGTGHFRLPLSEGQALVKALRGTISGLCQPTYVLDIPGGYGKVPVGPDWISAASSADGTVLVEDINGRVHRYPGSGLEAERRD
jgi:lysine 2,3-aminomutase